MYITMTSTEICELLGITKRNLKAIVSRDKVGDRLVKVGYKLMGRYKQGRENIYELEEIKEITWREYQTCHNVPNDKKEDHTKYTQHRITKGLKDPRNKVIKDSESNISSSTAKRYDDILISDNVIEFEKTVYYLKNSRTDEWIKITKEGYSRFWERCSEATYYLNENYRRFKKGEISRSTYEDTAYSIKDSIANEHGEIALKFNTYKEAEHTQNILRMIKDRNSEILNQQ